MPHLQVIDAFDDTTMIKEFAQSGAWLLSALAAIANTIYAQYGVMMVGTIPSLREQGRDPGRVCISHPVARPDVDVVSFTLNEKWLGSASEKPSPYQSLRL